MLTLAAMEDAADIVYQSMSATPQYCWPLLSAGLGTEVWVKHENHTPVGAFKVRGGLTFMHNLAKRSLSGSGVISATRGNHGQSIAFAAAKYGIRPTIVVPEGNSTEKNAAMRALGAELVEHGADFDAAKAHANALQKERDLIFVPSFHADLVAGVATYSLEFLRACPDLDVIYVPIGLGSGICGMISARNALGLRTEIVGVVSKDFDCYARAFVTGSHVMTPPAFSFADGMAVRAPNPEAVAVIREGAARVITVSDHQIADAVRLIYETTHNLAEGAGAGAVAGLMSERDRVRGKKTGVILSGQNIDRPWMASVLGGKLPSASH